MSIILSNSTQEAPFCVQSEFTDGGSKVNFWLGEHNAQIVTEAGASRREGLVYTLTIDGTLVPE